MELGTGLELEQGTGLELGLRTGLELARGTDLELARGMDLELEKGKGLERKFVSLGLCGVGRERGRKGELEQGQAGTKLPGDEFGEVNWWRDY